MSFRIRPLAQTMAQCAAVAILSLTLPTSAKAQQMTLPLWPHSLPQPSQTDQPETDVSKPTDMISGHHTAILTDITHPTLAVYPPPQGKNTHAAALVFPGGGYQVLAWDGEGLDACKWLNSLGMTCVLVKYRVPEAGRFPANPADLQDAQQAIRLTRAHATDWHIDAGRVGVMGFSAGGNLAALLSNYSEDHSIESTPAATDVDAAVSARPNFAILAYPAYLALEPEQAVLDPVYTPTAATPRTFLVAAENDTGYGKNSLVYYRALLDAKRPAELHMFANGGHGFGVYPNGAPAHWTELAATWLRSIHILPPPAQNMPSLGGTTAELPCPTPNPPSAGRPAPTTTDPNCP